jgi:hypothetical protein
MSLTRYWSAFVIICFYLLSLKYSFINLPDAAFPLLAILLPAISPPLAIVLPAALPPLANLRDAGAASIGNSAARDTTTIYNSAACRRLSKR